MSQAITKEMIDKYRHMFEQGKTVFSDGTTVDSTESLINGKERKTYWVRGPDGSYLEFDETGRTWFESVKELLIPLMELEMGPFSDEHLKKIASERKLERPASEMTLRESFAIQLAANLVGTMEDESKLIEIAVRVADRLITKLNKAES